MRPSTGGATLIASGTEQWQEKPETDQRADSQSDVVAPVEEDDNSISQVGSAADFSDVHRTLNTKEQILSTNLLDARDALDLITVAGLKDGTGKASLNLEDQHPNPGQIAATSEHARPISGSVSTAWSQFFLVRRGIVRTSEAIEYLDFYFSHLWYLFPVVSQWYASPDRYELLAVEEPVLAVSLITTASRYHPLTGFNGHARSERIHWRTWPWVQRLLQSSIWGSSAMRRLGSIASLLLFIEWHPRAINSPEDLVSDCSEMELFDPQNTTNPMDSYRRSDSSSSIRATDPSLREIGLDIEYYYVRLCGLSPTAHMVEKTTENNHTPDTYTASLSPFAEAATKASVDMLQLTTRYFATPSSSVIFRHSPVRYWLYIFCASLYLLKATLRTEEPLSRTNPHINLILQTVNGIRDNAPDDIHMSQRYAELLEILINTAMRPSTMNYNNNDLSGSDGGSNRRVVGDHSSPDRVGRGTLLDAGNPLGLGDDWIYDSSFWDTLPDMVGLNSIPDLVLPCYE
ncbi:hypothetical protein BDV59DRAFT_202534 [Aspergillus ambiguus]|uniref:uncharacterized protein n=1 Tax=Aspergillus ambiguus TaxID=176160 RepID=UPI003CCDEBE8